MTVGNATVEVGPVRPPPPPGEWRDEARLEDNFYFGAFGGVSYAIVGVATYGMANGAHATLHDLQGPVSWTVAYDAAWWPLEFFAIDAGLEIFGLPFDTLGKEYDEGAVVAGGSEGVGFQTTPTLRVGLPLRYVQLDAGLGIGLPVTLQGIHDASTGKSKLAFEVGASARVVAGVNYYVARGWRVVTEYHFDYRFATIHDEVGPLVNDKLVRHSAVLGFWASPEDFNASPDSDRGELVAGLYGVPLGFYALLAIIKAAVH